MCRHLKAPSQNSPSTQLQGGDRAGPPDYRTEVLQTLVLLLSVPKGMGTGLKQESRAASYCFLSVLQESSA